jgi:hypothetical protein
MVMYRSDNFQVDVKRIRQSRKCWKCSRQVNSGEIYIYYRLLERNYANGFWNNGCEVCFKAWIKDVSKIMIDVATSISKSNGHSSNVVDDMYDINGGNSFPPKPTREQRFNDDDRVRTLLGLLAGGEQQ